MRAAISLLVLLLSMCGVQTESHGTDFDLSTELKELRDMVVEMKGRHVASEADNVAMKQRLVASESKVEALEADNIAMKQRLAASERKVEVLEADNVAMKQRLVASENKVEALEAENKAVKERLTASDADNVAMKQWLVASESKVEVLDADNVAMKQRLVASENKVEVLEAENKSVKERLAARESKVEVLERALRDTNAKMNKQVDNLKTENAATEKKVENLEKEIKAAPKVAFSAGLRESGKGHTESGSNDLNLVFKRVFTNVGEAYCSTTGIFTAPVRGVYYFRFTVMNKLEPHRMIIMMHKNGKKLMQLYEYDTDGQPSYLSSGLTLQLEKGDTVNTVLPAGHRVFENIDYNYNTFSGFLLFPL